MNSRAGESEPIAEIKPQADLRYGVDAPLLCDQLLLTAAQSRELDKICAAHFDLPTRVLMQRAGQALAELVTECAREQIPQSALIWCGKGNNGGDGLVAACVLLARGWTVRVWFPQSRTAPPTDLAEVIALAANMLGPHLVRNQPPDGAWTSIDGAPILVDALLGTGLTRAAEGTVAQAIEAINTIARSRRCTVVSADVPSGMDADTGIAAGACVRPHFTLCFGTAKPGVRGNLLAGKVFVAGLGIPDAALRMAAASAPDRA